MWCSGRVLGWQAAGLDLGVVPTKFILWVLFIVWGLDKQDIE